MNMKKRLTISVACAISSYAVCAANNDQQQNSNRIEKEQFSEKIAIFHYKSDWPHNDD